MNTNSSSPISLIKFKHAVRYLLSKCFPNMSGWIVERIHQTEIETRNRIIRDVEHDTRSRRQTEGWISGYRIKTKRYSAADEALADESLVVAEAIKDNAKSVDKNRTCPICILGVESGDIVADLSCGHLYHTDCVSEWILKKVCMGSDP